MARSEVKTSVAVGSRDIRIERQTFKCKMKVVIADSQRALVLEVTRNRNNREPTTVHRIAHPE